MRVAEALLSARLIYFSGITLSLYSNTGIGRFLAVLEARAQAGRQGRVRRQFPPARLERRPRAHPHRVHRGAQARRHRAADVRRRGGVVGRSHPGGDGRAAAGLRHRRDRGQERPEQRAGRVSRRASNSCRCRKSWCRSIRRRPGTASTPAIWRRGSPARSRRRSATAAHRLAGDVIRHHGAFAPRADAAMH